MTDAYEISIDTLRMHLRDRKDLAQRKLSAQSRHSEDYRRLIRIYSALLRRLEVEVAFERELKGHIDVRQHQ